GVSVAVCVDDAVGGELATVSDSIAVVFPALVAKALTVLVKVVGDAGAGDEVAFTVIVAEAPIARLVMRTSKLELVIDVTVPAVVMTLLITSHAGKSASLITTPLALWLPVFVTTIV